MTLTKSQLQEDILALYLRLNGYFVTGFVVHSPEHGKNKTQIDALGVRFAGSREPEREVEASPYLGIPDGDTDLVICEVKSRGQPLQFNAALRDSVESIRTILRWAGMLPEAEIPAIADQVATQMQPASPPTGIIPTVRVPAQRVTVRALVCSPERHQRRVGQAWFIPGEEVLGYLSSCLAPRVPRPRCSAVYDCGQWGPSLGSIVKYFKDRGPGDPGMMSDLYRAMGVK